MNGFALDRDLHVPLSSEGWLWLVLVIGGIVVLTRSVEGTATALLMGALGFVGYLFDAHLYIPLAILLAVTLTFVRYRWPRSPDAAPLPRRNGRAFLFDLALAGGGFLLYELGRLITEGEEADAIRNAEWILSLQRALRLPSEVEAQAEVLLSDRATAAFNWTYSFMFLSTVVGVLIWLYLNDAMTYRLVRNALGVSALLAITMFALFPVAPPRLTPASGLIDSHARVGLHHGFVNEFAAVPSLHVGWTLLVGWGLARSLGGWHGRLLGVLPGLVMWATVVVTGNHFWVDGAFGALVSLAPALVLERMAIRPLGTRTAAAGVGGIRARWRNAVAWATLPLPADPTGIERHRPLAGDPPGSDVEHSHAHAAVTGSGDD